MNSSELGNERMIEIFNKMTECWINVYISPIGITYLGAKFSDKSIAEYRATFMTDSGKRKLLYRIHVKLK